MLRVVATLLAALVAFVPRASLALEPPPWVAYDCPGFENPHQCFLDVDNDGCFGAGDGVVQLPLLEGLVELDGGLVCPPRVPPIDLAGPPLALRVLGDVRFHGTRITLAPDTTLILVARNDPGLSRIGLDAVDIRGAEGAEFQAGATGSIHFGGRAIFAKGIPGADESDFRLAGFLILPGVQELTVANSARIAAGAITLAHTDKVSVGLGVNLQSFGAPNDTAMRVPEVLLSSRGSLETRNLRIRARGLIQITSGGPLSLRGRSALRAEAPEGDLLVNSTASAVTIDRLAARVQRCLTIAGDSVQIGNPDDAPARRSSVRAGGIGCRSTIEARGALDLERLQLRAHRVTLTTEGTSVDLRKSRVRGRTRLSSIDVTTGAGSTCDFTGSKFLKTTLSENCGSLIGP